MVLVGQRYKHFKGHIYEILNIAYDTENPNKKYVVYKNIEDHKVWVREYEMFTSKVDKEKYPNISQEYRFELLEWK